MAPVSDRGGGSSKGRELSLDDCRCPVCLEIFMEPVTLPCTHTFCKECFLETVDKATLCCPMCRKRVSTWARLNSRNNTLVDQQLWTHIQTAFPLQCQRRLSGQDAITEDEPGVSVCFPRVSQPGELKREYEDQVTKLTEEKRAMEEEEQRASEEYIQRLLAEEEELLQEERRRREDDERLARLLSNQLNSNPASRDNLGPADVTPAKKKKKDVSGGQMDKFLCPLPSNNSLSSSLSSRCSFVSNKENILGSQVELQVERPLPNLDYYGPQRDRSEPPSVSMDNQLHPGTHRNHMTGDKRKSSELDMTEDEEETVTKRGCLLLPSSSSSSSSSSLQVEVLQGVSEWEVEQLRRRQQEEDDRRLALLLQKELDQEEKQRATDRRKDSSDPYLLRPNSRGKVEATGPDTPSRKTSTSSTRTPTSSSKTSSTSTRISIPSSKTSASSTRTPPPSPTSSSRTSSSKTSPTSSSRTSSTSSSRTSSSKTSSTSSSRTSSSKTSSTSSSTRTSIPSSRSSTSSSRTSSNSSSRGSKQATLTEMFSSLIS